MKAEHPIVGDVRAKGCLMGIELVKDRATKEPFDKAGELVYQKAFRKGLAWIPAGHILRMSPPIVMDDDTLLKGLDLIDEAIGETEKELGYATAMKRLRFGIIGCGLMGREFASAAARWCHLPEMDVRPGNRGRLRQERGPAALVHGAISPSIAPSHAATTGPLLANPASTPSTAPCRTICTGRSTARPSRPANT